MVIVDESLSLEIRKFIESSCDNVKSLGEFDTLIPSNVFNVVLVDQVNLPSICTKIHRPKKYLSSYILGGRRIAEDELVEMEFYTFINKSLSSDAIKKQLEIFMKENSTLEKIQFSLNKRFKAELEERATFLDQLNLNYQMCIKI